MSTNILEKIMAERRADAEAARRVTPAARLLELARSRRHHSLAASLRSTPAPRIIAEAKKASPSAGVLVDPYEPDVIARQYETAGAAGVSVLTEPRHFLGDGEHIRQVRRAVSLPILRKDFISDPYQIQEAAAWGADVVLLIVAGLDRPRVLDLYAAAVDLRLDVLVEVHTPEELKVALECGQAILGVNSRNLKTLKTDLAVALALAPQIPKDRLAIAESGIRTREDVRRLQDVGYAGFLIGESLLRGGDPGRALRALRS